MTPPRPEGRGFYAGVSGVSPLVGDYCFYLNDHRVGGTLRGLPLGTSGHSNGVPSRGINPQTLKEIASSLKTPTLQVICVVVNSAKMLGMTTLKRLRGS